MKRVVEHFKPAETYTRVYCEKATPNASSIGDWLLNKFEETWSCTDHNFNKIEFMSSGQLRHPRIFINFLKIWNRWTELWKETFGIDSNGVLEKWRKNGILDRDSDRIAKLVRWTDLRSQRATLLWPLRKSSFSLPACILPRRCCNGGIHHSNGRRNWFAYLLAYFLRAM